MPPRKAAPAPAGLAPCPAPAAWPPALRKLLKEQLFARFGQPFGSADEAWRALLRVTFRGQTPAGWLPFAATDAECYAAAVAFLERPR